MISILGWDNFERKIRNWVHENPNDIQQIKNRALIVAVSPVLIGFIIGLIVIAIIKVGGGL